MASIEKRRNRDGSITHRVVWREVGQKQTESFTDRVSADQFRLLVEGSGNRWPRGWIKGHGFDSASTDDMPTFAEWGLRAIESRARANDRTRHDYMRDFNKHLRPVFGRYRLDEISTEDVDRWLIAAGRTMAPKTLKNVHGLGSLIYANAVEAEKVARNPFKGRMAKLPIIRQEEMTFLTPQEADVLLGAMHEHFRPFVVTLLGTGMRWSEATALKVSDVDLLGRRPALSITKAWKRQPDSSYLIGEPKTRRSRRTITLGAEVVESLIPLVSSREPSEFLFTTPTGRVVLHTSFRPDRWLPAVEKARAESGLQKRPRIHDLRHTHASWLIAAGVPLPAIQYRLGHESIQTTVDRYGHLADDMDATIAAALDGLRPVRQNVEDHVPFVPVGQSGIYPDA